MPALNGVSPSLFLPRSSRPFVLWLALAQLVSWGTLYYAFALLLVHFEKDFGLSRVNASLALSLALLAEGAGGYAVGRLIDRGRARMVMGTGSLMACLGLLSLSLAQTSWQFYGAWLIIGLSMSATLYQPAFSVLTRRYPSDFRQAIIAMTIIAGLASTVFIPLTAQLIAFMGWRLTVVVLALFHLLVCLPIHLHWLRFEPSAPTLAGHAAGVPLQTFTAHLPFWGLAIFFTLFSASASAMAGHFVTILRERGFSETWVMAIPASIGLLQVAGRLLLFVTDRYLNIHQVNRWVPLLLPAALLVLILGTHSIWAGFLYALLYGLANGLITVVKGTAMATYVSQPNAASLNGLLTLPTAIMRAAAPSALAYLWGITGNYNLGLQVFAALSLLATAAFWMAQRRALR